MIRIVARQSTQQVVKIPSLDTTVNYHVYKLTGFSFEREQACERMCICGALRYETPLLLFRQPAYVDLRTRTGFDGSVAWHTSLQASLTLLHQ